MRRTSHTLLALAISVILLTDGAVAQRTDSAQARLRAAADVADVEGDLRKAIAQYQAIADAFPSDRAVVATALRPARATCSGSTTINSCA